MATFCIRYEPGPNWIANQPTSRQDLFAHGKYMHDLLKRGQLIQAGPFPEQGGMALVVCDDEAAAQTLATQDPAVSSGVMVATVYPWRVMFDRASGRSPFPGDQGRVMPNSTTSTTLGANERPAAEILIRNRVEDLVKALCARDIDRIMSLYAPDLVSFDIVPPLRYTGAENKRRAWEEVFTKYTGPFAYEVRDVNVAAHGDLAFVCSLNHVNGTSGDGHHIDLWLRWTACFRRIDGDWLVVHDHASVPADLQHGQAALNLVP